MSRKNGCPMSVREWVVEILSRAATKQEPVWLRIRGLNSITLSLESESEDGSTADSLWSEPYVLKRSGALKLEGKPAADPTTGERDAGQAELNYFASLGGFEGDATLRLIDPYGHARLLDVIVTDSEVGAQDGAETAVWELALVGEAEEIPYVQAVSISAEENLSLSVNETKAVAVAFSPENASNQKFTAASKNSAVARVRTVDGLSVSVTGVSKGNTQVVLRSMNNSLSFEINVTVE